MAEASRGARRDPASEAAARHLCAAAAAYAAVAPEVAAVLGCALLDRIEAAGGTLALAPGTLCPCCGAAWLPPTPAAPVLLQREGKGGARARQRARRRGVAERRVACWHCGGVAAVSVSSSPTESRANATQRQVKQSAIGSMAGGAEARAAVPVSAMPVSATPVSAASASTSKAAAVSATAAAARSHKAAAESKAKKKKKASSLGKALQQQARAAKGGGGGSSAAGRFSLDDFLSEL